MRNAVIDAIHEEMKINKNIYFITGDLGYTVLEKIEADFPDRFINAGIAEQNIIGMASGLALSGKKVFVYSIIPFITMRCLEQIRNDICFHNLDVTILGSGAGLSYGILSNSHFALEDIAVLRSLPNINIFSPADEVEALLVIRNLLRKKTPAYFRIGKKQEPVIFTKPYDFKYGKGIIIKKGKDLVIFTTGPIAQEVIDATSRLVKEKKLSVEIVNVHTIKPIDKDLIIKESRNKKLVVTVEEHGKTGGLGSAVAEVLCESSVKTKLLRIGTGDTLLKKVGSQNYLRKVFGLDSSSIYKIIAKHYGKE